MTALPALGDCCPECYPGDFPATFPHHAAPDPEHPASLLALYRCTQGHEWRCWWDPESAGWPAARSAA